ncbi:hypothetical protein [Embleya scabrispora]|uniref:hypothetical protein n=1 Tax=Embleya scabrispora TaxID=159449 RepID=UPI00038246E2|nr:hypothetical protein [Embleya scabrispora]MYS85799.1 hypothetical protein [Streptomyces sp. SID5474]
MLVNGHFENTAPAVEGVDLAEGGHAGGDGLVDDNGLRGQQGSDDRRPVVDGRFTVRQQRRRRRQWGEDRFGVRRDRVGRHVQVEQGVGACVLGEDVHAGVGGRRQAGAAG